jgi:hypothetical protein
MTTQKAFQSNYDYYLSRGHKGHVARPGEPTVIDYGIAGEDLEPGDAVYFDTTAGELDFKKPTSAATKIAVAGIVLYDEGTVPNDIDGNVVIKSGAQVRVGVKGTFYAEAGSALTYGAQVIWDDTTAENNWTELTLPTTYALAHRNPGFCADREATDGDLFALRFFGPIK